MPNIIEITRMYDAARKLEAIRDQLDELLAIDPCGCGECDLCHGLAMLTNDAESLACTCRGNATIADNRLNAA